jgi:flagellar basal-body rod protein FlgB
MTTPITGSVNNALFGTSSMTAIEVALAGVAERQRVASHNIANVNTPGFRSSRVAFEAQLAEALERGVDSVARVRPTDVRANTPINTRGNDVALELENQTLITAGLQYEALVNALNHKFGVLRTALGRS